MTPDATAPIEAAKKKGKRAVAKLNQRLEALDIVYLKVDEIYPNSYNPNRQSEREFELLTKSMEEDGFTQPAVVVRITAQHVADGENQGYPEGSNVIVDGEHRWRCATKLGYDEIPCVLVPHNLAQARISTLRHNRARGSEDMELSAQVLRDLQTAGQIDWAQDSLMLDDVELNRLLDDVPAPEALAGDEYGQAWDPAKSSFKDGDDPEHQFADRRASATAAAVEAQREAERKMGEARSDEERESIRRDLNVVRFALTFAGDEAKMVKAAMGDRSPAQAILEFCQREIDEKNIDVETEEP